MADVVDHSIATLLAFSVFACSVVFFVTCPFLDFVPYVGVLELNLFGLELKREGRFGIKLKLMILRMVLELEADSTRNTELGEGGRLLAPQEACKQIAEVVEEAIRKMEMVADEKLRLLKKARLAVETCEHELEDKAREVAELKLERQRRKQKIDELESIVKLKQAEAEMFQLKADEARREAEMLQNIALAKSEKSEEDYRSSYLKLKLSEAEAEKQYLFQKMKLQESSRPLHPNDGNDSSQMFSKIQDVLKNAYNVSPNADCQASDRNSGRKNA